MPSMVTILVSCILIMPPCLSHTQYLHYQSAVPTVRVRHEVLKRSTSLRILAGSRSVAIRSQGHHKMRVEEKNSAHMLVTTRGGGQLAHCPPARGPSYGHRPLRALRSARPPTKIASGTDLCSKK